MQKKLHYLMNKVPQVTLIFWLIKMMSTTVGETGADYLAFNFHLGLPVTALITGLLLLFALFFEITSTTQKHWLYWLNVLLISVFGTLTTDLLTDQFGVPLIVSTLVFSVTRIGAFWVWYRSEKTLSIHHINTPKREMYYWIVILFTFALGTAVGDLVAESFNLGYLNATLLFSGIISSIALAFFANKKYSVLWFWLAYILTRPLGAALGDLLSQPTSNGGLGLGTSIVSIVFLGCICTAVAYSHHQAKQSQYLR